MAERLMQAPKDFLHGIGIESEEDIHKMAYAVTSRAPFLEGPWMTKKGKRYYLQYAVPGTEFNIYGDGVYVSDFPLGPFRAAENNPYSYKPGGFINGAGHGSTMEDKGQYWHISTMGIGCNYPMERRIGLWKAGFDAQGELFCDQRYGDWPIRMDAEPYEKPEKLDTWIESAKEYNIPELQTFVEGILKDLAAIKNGIIYPYNNGLAEGSVNKIKVIKRIVYGRNSFELLKAKVLFHELFHCEFN